jgi:endonuclease IV
MRPTEIAETNFHMAFVFTQGQKQTIDNVMTVLNQLAQGLSAMNTGLRATYMKLEEIERQMKR